MLLGRGLSLARFRGPVAVVLATGLGACLANPPTTAELQTRALPTVTLPAGWLAVPADTTPVTEGWLVTLGDTQLVALVAEAVAHNADLAVAAARVDQAAGLVKVAGGQVYPSLDVVAKGGIGLGGDASGINGALLRAAWEFDLWGRVRYGRAAAQVGYQAASFDAAYARQSLAGLLAKSWFLATETRFQMRLAESAIQASARLAELVEVRRRVGSASDLDLALARAEVAGYRDRLVELTRIEAESRRAIEVLLGRYPAAAIALRETFPESLPPVPAGLPLQLLERRPDLVAANFRVSQAFFARKQAVAARLPTLSLTGSFGALSSEILSFKADFSNPVGSIGAGLLVPLFRGGALKGQVDVRTAEQRAAVAAYGGSVLTSFQEVENALAAEQILRQRLVLLELVAREMTNARKLRETQYATGKIDLSPVLEMRMREYAAETALLRVRAERVTQRVNLYLALGGGFEAQPAAPPGGQ